MVGDGGKKDHDLINGTEGISTSDVLALAVEDFARVLLKVDEGSKAIGKMIELRRWQ